ncbi:uncharacterized protein LOC100182832, partial [Ciona intestinalis]
MVRTKATVNSAAFRASAAKAPRKNVAAPSRLSAFEIGSPAGKKNQSVGGNPVCQRPTPDWQKPIASFFTTKLPSAKSNGDTDLVEKLFEPVDKETPDEPEKMETSDDKENQNPEVSDEAGPSTSRPTKTKRRRILTIQESDSETEEVPSGEKPSTFGEKPSTSGE